MDPDPFLFRGSDVDPGPNWTGTAICTTYFSAYSRISGFMYMLIENPFLDLIIYILVFYSIFTNMKK